MEEYSTADNLQEEVKEAYKQSRNSLTLTEHIDFSQP